MRRIALFSVIMIVLAFLLPMAFASPPDKVPEPPRDSADEPVEASPAPEAENSPEPEHGRSIIDSDIALRVLDGGEVREMSMAEYLPLTLAAEMPAAFDGEALKAQAVAPRTYTIYNMTNRKQTHPDADICTDYGCCAAFADEEQLRETWGSGFEKYYAKILSAVSDTDGQYLVWQDEPALAVFHSSSVGQTEDSASVWSAQPYLVSVSSPETERDVSNLVGSVEVSPSDFSASVLAVYPDAQLSGEPSGWLGEVRRNSSGRVGSMYIGGQEISGTAVRTMFSLRSTDFDLSFDGEKFVFTVRGYGHGVGMSQYGANVMAKNGSGYGEILEHYYPGTELVVSVYK